MRNAAPRLERRAVHVQRHQPGRVNIGLTELQPRIRGNVCRELLGKSRGTLSVTHPDVQRVVVVDPQRQTVDAAWKETIATPDVRVLQHKLCHVEEGTQGGITRLGGARQLDVRDLWVVLAALLPAPGAQ